MTNILISCILHFYMADKRDVLRVEGRVEEALPDAYFRASIAGREDKVLVHLSGKMRLHRIRVLPGDRVVIEMTSKEEKRGRIVRRL